MFPFSLSTDCYASILNQSFNFQEAAVGVGFLQFGESPHPRAGRQQQRNGERGPGRFRQAQVRVGR